MSELRACSRDALSEGGALAEAIPGFVPRPAQQRLARRSRDAFDDRGVLLAEAGTGTGKTFRLPGSRPAVGQKTIVSTGTRALQDQLYLRDLPRVRDALGIGMKTALLKGRANYLCKYRLEQARANHAFQGHVHLREQISQFQRIVAWSGRTRMGDMAELEALPEDSPLLPLVTSTTDNCLGSDCPFWCDCFVVQARQRAQSADVVVVNHHLLLADLALKQEGFGEILPGAQAFVVDEAHQLPELAAQFFGEGLGARPLVELARDALGRMQGRARRAGDGAGAGARAGTGPRELRAAMEGLPPRGTPRGAGPEPVRDARSTRWPRRWRVHRSAGSPLRDAAPGFDACAMRAAQDFAARLARWRVERDCDGHRTARATTTCAGTNSPRAASACSARRSTCPARCASIANTRAPRGYSPRRRSRSPAVSTMSRPRLGLDDAARRCWSPARSTGPPGPVLPAAAHAGTRFARLRRRPDRCAASGAGSLGWPRLPAVRFAPRPARGGRPLRGAPWPLFVQGEAPRYVLLQRFRDSGNGVLLGAASFREGVDVAGDALAWW